MNCLKAEHIPFVEEGSLHRLGLVGVGGWMDGWMTDCSARETSDLLSAGVTLMSLGGTHSNVKDYIWKLKNYFGLKLSKCLPGICRLLLLICRKIYGPLMSSPNTSAQSTSCFQHKVFWIWIMCILKMDAKGDG